MRRLSLGTLLTALSVGSVAAVVVCVVAVATGMLHRFADEQGLARAGLAGLTAARALERSQGDLQVAARLLSDRPTLARLLQEGNQPGLEGYLALYRRTSRLSGCAVFRGSGLYARDGAAPWDGILHLPRGGEGAFLRGGPSGSPFVLGAWSDVPSFPGSRVVVALRLDDEVLKSIALQVGLPVSLVDRDQTVEEGPRTLLRDRVLNGEEAQSERLDEAGQYVAIQPLRGPGGVVIGLLETGLPITSVLPPERHLIRALVLVALLIGGLAALSSILVGRRLLHPLESLTDASRRIGTGDLATPIPRVTGGEIESLGATMEEMRGRLLQLTAELRGRKTEAEAILAGITEGVFSVDRERRIQYLNPQAAAILGIDAGQAIGRFCGDVLDPQGTDGVRPCDERCPIVHARFRGSARATEDLRVRTGARRSVVIASGGAPFPGAVQFQVMRDETEVEAARRQRDAILAHVTHEFRTPLTAQLASIELLSDRLPELTPEEARDLILSLRRGTLRLTQLIDNLLESVRIESGHRSIRRRPLALEEVVDEAVDMAAPLLALRGQTLNVDLPYPIPPLVGDAPRLVQVFVNLLANANKYAPPGSAIAIGGEVRKGEVALWVEDEGPGLPQEGDDRLFEQFVRAPGEEPNESGVGLGLFIVKSIVERHGGRVEAGRRPGESGARLSVILPQEAPA